MSQTSTSINSKLIDSLAQIILSLTKEERNSLEQKIKPSSSNEIETKFETLQHDINLGINQIQNGDYTEYDDLSLPNLLETIKIRGNDQLGQEFV
jgi:hypothetical protein